MKKYDIVVIGLGIFGKEVALRLTELGHNVLVIDMDEQKINQIKDSVAEAIVANAANEEVLQELRINNFDYVILGMSSNFENIVLSLTYLKKLGTKQVFVKANTDIQSEILIKIGADRVILADKEVAYDLANEISSPNISEVLKVDDNINLMEVKVLKNMEGKSLKELDLRRKYNITALIHKKNDKEKAHIITDASMILKEGDSLLVAGDKNNIYKAFS